jgi:hypothetical protein
VKTKIELRGPGSRSVFLSGERRYDKARVVDHNLLYLRKMGGISVEEWEQAILSTPGTRIIYQSESEEDVGGIQFRIKYGGPGAEVLVPYDPKVWVRSGETHFWSWTFFYTKGEVRFHRPSSDSIRSAAVHLAEKLGASIVDESEVEVVL